MFINLSNHPSEKWSREMISEATKYGEIIDIPFPYVEANWDEAQIENLANTVLLKIEKYDRSVIMIQGEFTLTYRLVNKCLKKGIEVVSACSERETEEVIMEDGATKKISRFRFVRFRKY